mmetsp:Transcript_8873/g.7850  ORF Transcript_8873/g.7850 Transcript_8873/m.7850 type:complete len:201 (+) Transcript_8873:448-1050(+)
MHLAVYNIISEDIRNLHILPSRSWGGSGSLGCKLSMGDEFAIPVPDSIKKAFSKPKTEGLFGSSLKSSKSQVNIRRKVSNLAQTQLVEMARLGIDDESKEQEDDSHNESQIGLIDEKPFSCLLNHDLKSNKLDVDDIEINVDSIKEDEVFDLPEDIKRRDFRKKDLSLPPIGRLSMPARRPETVKAIHNLSTDPNELKKI